MLSRKELTKQIRSLEISLDPAKHISLKKTNKKEQKYKKKQKTREEKIPNAVNICNLWTPSFAYSAEASRANSSPSLTHTKKSDTQKNVTNQTPLLFWLTNATLFLMETGTK